MSLKHLNEAFDRKFKNLQTEEVEVNPLKKELFRAMMNLEMKGVTNLKAYEVAFQDVIEAFYPENAWWEVVDLDIFWDLMETRNARETIHHILDHLKDPEKSEKTESVKNDCGSIEENAITESDIGRDLSRYQKWVDYDMDRYGRVSAKTQSLLRKNGLSLVKDQYGDYEVIAKRAVREAVAKDICSVTEWWGQTDEDPCQMARDFHLACDILDRKGDETLYKFTGKKEDIDKAKDAGYFFGPDCKEVCESYDEEIYRVLVVTDDEVEEYRYWSDYQADSHFSEIKEMTDNNMKREHILAAFQLEDKDVRDKIYRSDLDRRHQHDVDTRVAEYVETMSEQLSEDINQENAEINALLAKALRNREFARQHEKDVAKYGIKFEYPSGTIGTVIIGPNGRVLTVENRSEFWGPAEPGFNDTHLKKDSSWDRQRADYHRRKKKEYEDLLNRLQNMDDYDLGSQYPGKTKVEAQKLRDQDIQKLQDRIKEEEKDIQYYTKNADSSDRHVKKARRSGHDRPARYDDRIIDRSKESVVDLFNYLTKDVIDREDREAQFRYDNRTVSPLVAEYQALKSKLQDAKNSKNFYSRYYPSMSQKQLDAKIEEMKANLQKEIDKLKAANVRNASDIEREEQKVQAAQKAIDDFLRGKGVRK